MVCICTGLGPVCGPYLDPGQGGHRGGQLHSGHRHPHRGGAGHELGHGVPHPGPGGAWGEISRRSWLFLILSGLATGASWLCYYRALQLGRASQVVSIDKLSVVITLVLAFVFLHEPFTAKSMVGCALVAAGTLFMVL